MKKHIKSSAYVDNMDRIEYLETKIALLEDFINGHKYYDGDELADAQEQLMELKDELNFAWQDDEAEWNYAREQQEFNPDGSLKFYGSTRAVKAASGSNSEVYQAAADYVDDPNAKTYEVLKKAIDELEHRSHRPVYLSEDVTASKRIRRRGRRLR